MNPIAVTEAQKKILIIMGIVILAFIVFIVFIYLPLRRESIRIRKEYHAIEAEVNQIKKTAGQGKSLEESIVMLRKKLDAMNAKLPEKEEVVIRELSNALTNLGIEVVSIKPQRKAPLAEGGGIRGASVQEMPISISLKTSYKTLGEFFRLVREDLPVFLRADTVRMSKAPGKDTNLLTVDVHLNSYLVSSE